MGNLLREERLALVHPSLAAFIRGFVKGSPWDWMVVTGARTQEEVNLAWAKGRTTAGPFAGEPGHPPLGEVVTHVRSLEKAPHAIRATPEGAFSCAVDLMFFSDHCALSPGTSREDRAVYQAYGEAVMEAGLVWGGVFTGLVDLSHAENPRWREFPLFTPQGDSQ